MVQDFEEYYEDRFRTQRNWYSDKAAWHKRWFLRLKIAAVVLAAAVPVTVSVFETTNLTALYLLSLSLVTTETVLSILKLEENWLNYRTTAEALKTEGAYFRTRTGPYAPSSGHVPEELFVSRIEELISQENRVWRITIREEDERVDGAVP